MDDRIFAHVRGDRTGTHELCSAWTVQGVHVSLLREWLRPRPVDAEWSKRVGADKVKVFFVVLGVSHGRSALTPTGHRVATFT
jgi:hypothetical protein